ncbi:MAG: hypothetical protein ISS45_03315 [Candidatus Omnitrophica bacterium]|nr:hypothetical protein [Candidatus Omnitrophota bacterium]
MSGFKKWFFIVSMCIIVIGFLLFTLRMIDSLYTGTGFQDEEDLLKKAMEMREKYEKYKEVKEQYQKKYGSEEQILKKYGGKEKILEKLQGR